MPTLSDKGKNITNLDEVLRSRSPQEALKAIQSWHTKETDQEFKLQLTLALKCPSDKAYSAFQSLSKAVKNKTLPPGSREVLDSLLLQRVAQLKPLKLQIDCFNLLIHEFENRRVTDAKEAITLLDDLQVINKTQENTLKGYLDALLEAENHYQLELYYSSLSETINTIDLQQDILEVNSLESGLHYFIGSVYQKCEHDEFFKKENNDESVSHLEPIPLIEKNFELHYNYVDKQLKTIGESIDQLESDLKSMISSSKVKSDRIQRALAKLKSIRSEVDSIQDLVNATTQKENAFDYRSWKTDIENSYWNLQQLSQVNAIQQLQNVLQKNTDVLYQTRMEYLEKNTGEGENFISLIKDFGSRVNHWRKTGENTGITQSASNALKKPANWLWMTAGLAVLIPSIIVGAPAAVLAVGLGVVAYGCFDLGKEIVNAVSEPIAREVWQLPELGRAPTSVERVRSPSMTNTVFKHLKKNKFAILNSAIGLASGVIALTFPILTIPAFIIGIGCLANATRLYVKESNKEKREVNAIKLTAEKKHAALTEQLERESSHEQSMMRA